MSQQKKWAIALIVISVVLTVVSYFVLPETVIIQIAMNANGNATLTKPVAILMPAVLSIAGAVFSLLSVQKGNKAPKGILISVVGVAIFAAMIVVNTILVK